MALESFLYGEAPTAEDVREMILRVVGSSFGVDGLGCEDASEAIDLLLRTWEILRASESDEDVVPYLNEAEISALFHKLYKQATKRESDYWLDMLPDRAPKWLVVEATKIYVDRERALFRAIAEEESCKEG